MSEKSKTAQFGYTGHLLRVDLSRGKVSTESINATMLRTWLGGAGLGAKILYDEVPKEASWDSEENRIIIATGPVTGTPMGGTGSFCVVAKGALTGGATVTEANGFFGAFLKSCGYDAIVVQGAAEKLKYLRVYDGGAELKDATHLAAKDTWETEDQVKKELGLPEKQASVFSIGPAGENLVKFACLTGDKGHVAAHNGVGAVLGSKRLKAIVVARGSHRVELSDPDKFSTLSRGFFDSLQANPKFTLLKWGTLGTNSGAAQRARLSRLPIKNLTTNLWPGGDKLSEENVRSDPRLRIQKKPCWACRFDHCHSVDIVNGAFAGFSGDEPDYELWAAFGPLIDNQDLAASIVLSNDADRLGVDANETGWLVGWLMECSEKGVLTKELESLNIRWGDVAAVREVLRKISRREGFGNVLAEGVMRAAKYVGGDAQKLAVYTEKGNTPRGHDHRGSWPMILDTVTSDRGRDMDGPQVIFSPVQVGLPAEPGVLTPEGASAVLSAVRGRGILFDMLVVCRFTGSEISNDNWARLLNAATGLDFSGEEIRQTCLRVVNLLRLFNVKHGHKRELERPSIRYSSAPIDGLNVGKTIAPVWDETLTRYYRLMGWDEETGVPLPETLARLGLDRP